MPLPQLHTGDVVFCDYTSGGWFGWFSKTIKFFTQSKFSHCAIYLEDATFIDPSLREEGGYVWESSYNGKDEIDPQDGVAGKLGVQITPFAEFYTHYKENGFVYSRSLSGCANVNNDELKRRIHAVVYDKPYDIVPEDWVEALFRYDSDPQKTDRFWCSALAAYIYTQLGVLPSSTDWSVLRPSDLAAENLKVEGECRLSQIRQI